MAGMSQRELAAFMAAIRLQESSNNYRAYGPMTKYGRATGAYQFLTSTWGGYGGYTNAADAPPAVQDARAAQLMSQYFAKYNDWGLVSVAWHAGPGKANIAQRSGMSALGNLGDGLMSTVNYARKAVTQMQRNLEAAGTVTGPGGGPESQPSWGEFGPEDEPSVSPASQGFTGTVGSTIARASDDPLGTGSGGPGTVGGGFGGGGGGGTAPTVAPVSFGDGTVDMSDSAKVDAEVEAKFGDMSNEEFLTAIYEDVLGRDPDKQGFDHWLSQLGRAPVDVEKKYGKKSDSQFVDAIFQDALGRPADAQGKEFWLGQLAGGMSRDDVWRNVSNSEEAGPAGGMSRSDVWRAFYASDEGGNTEPPLLSEVELMIRQKYPDWAWAMDIDEIRDILLEATDPTKGMDDVTFMSKIRETDWWQSTSATQRDWDQRASMDPAEAQAQIDREAVAIGRQATALGAEITPEQAQALAEKKLRFGLTDAQINDSLAAMFDSSDPRGDVAGNLRIARQGARDYMINVDDAELTKWAQEVAVGTANPEDLKTRFIELAKAKFSGNEQIIKLMEAGGSPATYFNDHKRMIASELDLSPEQVDLMDPKFTQILSSAQGTAIRPMDLNETRAHIRESSQFDWQSTSTGRARIAETTQGILRAFGKVA